MSSGAANGSVLAETGQARPAPRLQGTALASVASCLPDGRAHNSEVERRLGLEQGWISSRTGVVERRQLAAGETVTGMAAGAASEALARAGVGAEEVDLVLAATFTADDLLPNLAPLVAAEIGATGAGALDIGAACTGFLSALSLGAAQIESRRARVVLVLGAEGMSRVTDREDRSTAGLFGDGAGAAVLSPDAGGSLGPVLLGADAGGAGHITASHAERKVRMDGRATFRAAVNAMSGVAVEAAARAGVGLGQIDLFVFHQANRRILRAVGERLELDPERVLDCISGYGNTSAASIPIALADAQEAGRLQPGDRVLLAAFGAGFTWGATVLDWGAA